MQGTNKKRNMIKENDIFSIGKTAKTHGVNGEISFSFTTNIFDEEKCAFFVLEIDQIFVPFFIEEIRLKSNNAGFVKFEHINNEISAKELCNKTVYLPKKYAEKVKNEQVADFRYFIGFEVIEESKKSLGTIIEVHDETMNILFELSEKELLIPASEEYITDINHKKRIIYMTLPEGFLEL